MSKRFVVALSACAALAAVPAVAQRKSTGENALVGIKLFDSGLKVISVYGSPDDIQGVSVGTSSSGGGGGPAGGGKAGGVGGIPPKGGGPSKGSLGFNSPDFGDDIFRDSTSLNQMGPPSLGPGAPGGGKSGGSAPAGGSGGPKGGGSGAGGGSAAPVTYTRWVYNRGGSRYSFILDRFNRVLQIEAIGMQNGKVRTKRGIGFGSTFAQILNKYQAPEQYQINGDTIIVRYLIRDQVAFRLQRLKSNKPHVVTGIVVAAGK